MNESSSFLWFPYSSLSLPGQAILDQHPRTETEEEPTTVAPPLSCSKLQEWNRLFKRSQSLWRLNASSTGSGEFCFPRQQSPEKPLLSNSVRWVLWDHSYYLEYRLLARKSHIRRWWMKKDAKLVATRHPISLLLNLLPRGHFLFLRTSHHFFKKNTNLSQWSLSTWCFNKKHIREVTTIVPTWHVFGTKRPVANTCSWAMRSKAPFPISLPCSTLPKSTRKRPALWMCLESSPSSPWRFVQKVLNGFCMLRPVFSWSQKSVSPLIHWGWRPSLYPLYSASGSFITSSKSW